MSPIRSDREKTVTIKKPSFTKSSAVLVEFFDKLIKSFPEAELRKTFGYPCAYINRHMACGLFEDSMFLRLSVEDEKTFLKMDGVRPFAPMKDRPMKGYVIVPESLINSPKELKGWIKKSFSFVGTLPPKEKKPRKK